MNVSFYNTGKTFYCGYYQMKSSYTGWVTQMSYLLGHVISQGGVVSCFI